MGSGQGDYWGISKYHPEMNNDKVAQCESKVEYAIAGHPFPSPLKRAYTRVRGILGRVKRKVVG